MIKSNKEIIPHLPERRSHTIERDGICQRDHADWHTWEVWSHHGSGQKSLLFFMIFTWTSMPLWRLLSDLEELRHQDLPSPSWFFYSLWFCPRLIKPLHGHCQPLSLISRNLEIKGLIKFTLFYFPLVSLITKKFEKKFSNMFVTWRYRQRWNHHKPIAIATSNILSIRYQFESWSPCRYCETQLAVINERTMTIRWVNLQCLEL